MLLDEVYLAGAYFFVRAVLSPRWHRVAVRLLPVTAFATFHLGLSRRHAFSAGSQSSVLCLDGDMWQGDRRGGVGGQAQALVAKGLVFPTRFELSYTGW